MSPDPIVYLHPAPFAAEKVARTARCPTCKAKPGAPCTTPTGARVLSHKPRRHAGTTTTDRSATP